MAKGALKELTDNRFVEYVITVIAVIGGIVGLKVVFHILSTIWPNFMIYDINKVIQLG